MGYLYLFYLTRYRAARRSAALVAGQCLGKVGETDGQTDGRIAASLNAPPLGRGIIMVPRKHGTDFHRAMVATAPGEKLLIRRHPMRNWTQLGLHFFFVSLAINDTDGNSVRYQACFCAENYTCSWENRQKTADTRAALLSPIYTKSFVDWGFAPDPTGGAYSAPPDPVAVLRGAYF